MEKKNHKSFWIVTIILMLFSACCGWFIGYKQHTKSNQPSTKQEIKKTEEKTDGIKNFTKITEEEAEDLVAPFINLLYRGCSDDKYFYIVDKTTYKNISDEDKLEIAYQAMTSEINFEEFKKEELVNSYKKVFGSNKSVKLPKKLNIESELANYELKDDKYILTANGGGCTEFDDSITTKVVKATKDDKKITVRVNYGILSIDNKEEFEESEEFDESKITGTLYKSYAKTDVIEENINYNEEETIVSKVLSQDKTNYILFTFTKEKSNYIFEKAELIER